MKSRIIFLLFLSFLLTACSKTPEIVELPASDYNQTELKEFFRYEELEEKISSKEAFVLFVYTNFCDACLSFEPILRQFIEERNLRIYSIEKSLIKDNSWLDKQIGNVPTVLVISNKKKIAQLNPNDGNHINYYETKEGFGLWFDNYIKPNSEN